MVCARVSVCLMFVNVPLKGTAPATKTPSSTVIALVDHNSDMMTPLHFHSSAHGAEPL